jgi:hypothetical protein
MYIYGITYSDGGKKKVEFVDADSMLTALKRFKATFPARVALTVWISGYANEDE